MKPGDIVFFKEATRTSKRKAQVFGFKGHAFGVMLGHIPPFGQDPSGVQVLALLANVGFVSFDDVAEMLGQEAAARLVQKFQEKMEAFVLKATENETSLKTENMTIDAKKI